jgi:uncharacterized protein (DUF433 family)
MSVATTYEHVTLDASGVPIIENSTTKVVEIVSEMKAYGWSPEEIHFQHPYLSLGQIYSALAYYFDHVDYFEQDIASRLEKVSEIQNDIKTNGLLEKLEEQGLR